MTLDADITGYNPDEPAKEPKVWKVEKATRLYSAHPAVKISVNGNSRGLIFCEDEEEFEWVKRLNGTQE